MNRQLAIKLVSKMQTNVWNLTDKQAEIILGFLDSDNERSEQLFCITCGSKDLCASCMRMPIETIQDKIKNNCT